MGALFCLYFVTRTNHEGQLDEPIGIEFFRLIHSVREHPHAELRQLEAMFGLDLSIFQSSAEDVGFPIGELKYEIRMAQLHQKHDRAAGLQATLDEVLRQEELSLQQPPGEGWFEIATLKDVVERWQEKIAANPGYYLQLQFTTGWNWSDYFSDTAPASAQDARLRNDLDKLTEYIERAVWLGETHATFQISI